MAIITLRCSNCGDNMYSDETRTKAFCGSCGAENLITQDVVNIHNTIHNTTNHHTQQTINKTIIGKEKNEAEDYLKNGDVFLSLKDWDNAYEQYKKAVDAAPADWRGWFGISKTHLYDHSFVHSDTFYAKNYIAGLHSLFPSLSKAFAVADEATKCAMRQIITESGFLEKVKEYEQAVLKNLVTRAYYSNLFEEFYEKYLDIVEPDDKKQERIERKQAAAEQKRLKEEQERLEKETRQKALDSIKDCAGLTTLSIPPSIRDIPDGFRFINCENVTSIEILSSLFGLVSKWNLPGYFPNLSSITVTEDESASSHNYSSQDGILYNKEKTVIIYAPKESLSHIMLPPSITSINNRILSPFREIKNKSITIPDSVIKIDYGAFEGWGKKQTIYITKENFKRQHKSWLNGCKAKIKFYKPTT